MFLVTNSLNWTLVNDVPLSETKTSGIPLLAKSTLSDSSVASVDAEETTKTSIHFEYESTATNSIFPMNGPA